MNPSELPGIKVYGYTIAPVVDEGVSDISILIGKHHERTQRAISSKLADAVGDPVGVTTQDGAACRRVIDVSATHPLHNVQTICCKLPAVLVNLRTESLRIETVEPKMRFGELHDVDRLPLGPIRTKDSNRLRESGEGFVFEGGVKGVNTEIGKGVEQFCRARRAEARLIDAHRPKCKGAQVGLSFP
jgi:hypothetical protein